jgi:DNA polymerase elongation subunit (family B)
MIRKVLNPFNSKTTDIIFQVVDWKDYDTIIENKDDEDDDEENDAQDDMQDDEEYYENPYYKKKELIIRGYGVTENGNSIVVHINGFQPYFFFKVPEEWSYIEFKDFKNAIVRMVDDKDKKSLVRAEIIQKKEFYGFTNNELFKYGILVFKNKSGYYSYLDIMRKKKIILRKTNTEYDFSKKIYETKVDSILHFFHVRDIDPSGWIKIPANKYKINYPSFSRSQIDISVDFNEIYKYESNEIAKIVVASFDIECCSEDGSFPKFNKKNDPIIQIGTTVYIFGENECKLKYIAVLGECLPIEGAIVESYKNEKDMILGWANFINKLDPDIITGYNIYGFDWEYIYRRAESGNCGLTRPYHEYLFKKLQRLKPQYFRKKIELIEQKLESSAMGQNFLKYIDIEGIVQIDLLKFVQNNFKLDNYKLDNVAHEKMGLRKVDLSPKELFTNFKIGTPEKIQEIAIYCIMDCKLVNDLINKLDVITNQLGMSNVCVVPFSYLFLRGQGIKILSLVAKFCREENFLIKDLGEDDVDKSSYEGAIVFPPQAGVYFEPIVVMDYNSLYPSSMIAENISHDSIVGYKEYMIKPKMNINDNTEEYEVVKDTINAKYDNLEEYNYNEIQYDIIKGFDKDKKKVGYKVCRFAEYKNGEKSVLPRILRKLLKARKDTRKYKEYYTFILKDGSSMEGIPPDDFNLETYDKETIELSNVKKGTITILKDDVVSYDSTYTTFQKDVLEGLQLAYKVTCNSLYGQVGATTSSICYKELAACTTAVGREMVVKARDLTLSTFVGAKLTYGDSVTGDTPLLVMKNGIVNVMTIMELNDEWVPYDEFKPFDTNRKQKQQTMSDFLIWTSNGWSKINRVIRHKTFKKIYRITTDTGIIDVTEDHSLLSPDFKLLKPGDCNIGTELLHGFPTEFPCSQFNDLPIYELKSYANDIYNGVIDKIPMDILNASLECRIEFVKIFMEYDLIGLKQNSKLFFQSLYYLLKSVESGIDIDNKFFNIHLNGNLSVTNIKYLYDNTDEEYVYDIETETGNFHAGIGQLIVKNTDSIFVNFADYIKNKYPNRNFTETELLEESIKIGQEAAKNINKHVKAPQNIEYEKTFWPFCIFSKKRYFGNKFEFSVNKYKQNSMGIVLKRRDNANIVKVIYGGVMDIILNKRDIEASKKFFYDSVKNLIEGRVHNSQLIISKTVRTDYSNPNQIAHKVLADRMGERDPGNKPQSNDRIPYLYIDTTNLKCKLCKIKVSEEKCKCIKCMYLYCPGHLFNHRSVCVNICRYCKISNDTIKQCNTCTGLYCSKCDDRHRYRIDKYGNRVIKCKKELTNKLLQGDTIEHPSYVEENKLRIDYKYYLEHQILNPVYQIFELVMDKPSSIIEDLLRNMTNKKYGNRTIGEYFKKENKNISNTKIEDVKEDKFSIMSKIEIETTNYDETYGIDDENDEINLLEGFEEDTMEYDIPEIID